MMMWLRLGSSSTVDDHCSKVQLACVVVRMYFSLRWRVDKGGHYNPFGLVHGGPADPAEGVFPHQPGTGSNARHVGDLGNVVADRSGVATGVITDSPTRLFGVLSMLLLTPLTPPRALHHFPIVEGDSSCPNWSTDW